MSRKSIGSRLGTVIAARKLTVEGDGRRRSITVKLGAPHQTERGTWRCPFYITGIGMGTPCYAGGVDSMQALQEALNGIRVILDQSKKHLSWVGGEAAELTFPRVVPWGFGAPLAKKLDSLIETEVENFAKDGQTGTL
jgi:hypothetical protein